MNYVQLAFSFFDQSHCGYFNSDDLTKILHNCGLTTSRKGWLSYFGDNDKVYYSNFVEPSTIVEYKKSDPFLSSESEESNGKSVPVFIKDGHVFDIPKLIDQAERDEKLKAELSDQIKILQEKLGKSQTTFVLTW